jgi:CheY-like chemotaxis protein
VVHVKSILVVDDDPMFAGLLEDILKGDGHRVTIAGNGAEALGLLGDQAFDLIMIDIRMPQLDGPAFYRELEQRAPEQAGRVMFMTGGAVGAETAELLSKVRAPVLRKPLEVKEVRTTVQRFFLAADSFRRRG